MTTERPRALDLYSKEYHRVLERVRDEGKFFARFASSKEANTVKTDFNRYKHSVMAYMPGTWEAQLCLDLMVRMKGPALDFVKKSTSAAIADLRSQLDDPNHSGTTDEEAEALRKLDEDIMKGNY